MALQSIGIRLTNLTSGTIFLTDVDDGVDTLNSFQKAGPVYIAPRATVILVFTTSVALSFESGAIRGFINTGRLSGTFISIMGSPLGLNSFDDFVSLEPTFGLNWTNMSNGPGSGVAGGNLTEVTAAHQGIADFRSGTTATGRGGLRLASGFVYQGNQGSGFVEWMIKIPILSTGLESYFINVGYTDNQFGTEGFNSIAFRYDNGNWICFSRTGVLADNTAIDTGIAPVANEWTVLRIELNPAGADFYIGPTSTSVSKVATIPAFNLPDETLPFSPTAIIQKQVGVLLRRMFADYCNFGFNVVR